MSLKNEGEKNLLPWQMATRNGNGVFSLLIDLLKDVLKPAIILLQNGILCAGEREKNTVCNM